MSDDRRTVRVTHAFFETLDQALPPERGPEGEPSSHDFLVHELLRVVETFATSWDALPEVMAGRTDFRVLVVAGLLVPRFAVVGQLDEGGGIDLVTVHVDFGTDWA